MAADAVADPDWISHSELRRRGWTGAIVRALLGAPTQLTGNPHCAHARPMRLYPRVRALEIEASDRFQQALARIAAARERSRLRAAARALALVQWVATAPLTVRVRSREQLFVEALEHHLTLHGEAVDDPHDLLEAWPPPAPVVAWMECTYARRCLIDTASILDASYAQAGRARAEQIAMARVFGAIADAWPHLADEADRQFCRWCARVRTPRASVAPPAGRETLVASSVRAHRMSHAFEITEDDVLAVLRANATRVANTGGRDFEALAADLFDDLDHDAIEEAALATAGDLDEQTDAAHAALRAQLVEQGVLKR